MCASTDSGPGKDKSWRLGEHKEDGPGESSGWRLEGGRGRGRGACGEEDAGGGEEGGEAMGVGMGIWKFVGVNFIACGGRWLYWRWRLRWRFRSSVGAFNVRRRVWIREESRDNLRFLVLQFFTVLNV